MNRRGSWNGQRTNGHGPGEVGARMSSAADGTGRRRSEHDGGETRKERINRELIELLNELRVALPGVQFLFAFLLIVPFQQKDLTTFQLDVYFVALIASAVATGLLIAPAAQHRVLFRQHAKEDLLRRSHRSALAGLIALGVAICAVLLLVVDVLFSRTQAWLTSGAVALLLAWWWIAVPYYQRAHSRLDPLPEEDGDDTDGGAR
jgi:hypothetical protein